MKPGVLHRRKDTIRGRNIFSRGRGRIWHKYIVSGDKNLEFIGRTLENAISTNNFVGGKFSSSRYETAILICSRRTSRGRKDAIVLVSRASQLDVRVVTVIRVRARIHSEI